MARSNVPQFGNWESGDNVPYTVYFDKARKTRGEKIINPNDPLQNPDMFRSIEPPPRVPAAPLKPRTKPEEPIVKGSFKPIHEHRGSREVVGLRQARNENMGRRPPSFESAPHHLQGNTGRGIGSTAWEGTNYENSHGIRARSRLGPIVQEDNSPDKGAAVPRFGDWNENDPRSAENFTLVFNKVREERNPASGHVSNTPNHPSHTPWIQPSNEQKKCCFPWW